MSQLIVLLFILQSLCEEVVEGGIGCGIYWCWEGRVPGKRFPEFGHQTAEEFSSICEDFVVGQGVPNLMLDTQDHRALYKKVSLNNSSNKEYERHMLNLLHAAHSLDTSMKEPFESCRLLFLLLLQYLSLKVFLIVPCRGPFYSKQSP